MNRRLRFTFLLGVAFLPQAPIPLYAAEPGQTAVAATGKLAASVRTGRIPGRTRIVIDFDDSPDFRVESQAEPAEVLISVRNAALAMPLSARLFEATPVQAWDASRVNADDLTLKLQLDDGVRIEHFSLQPDDYGGHRLVVDLYNGQPELKMVESTAAPLTPLGSVLSTDDDSVGNPQPTVRVPEQPRGVVDQNSMSFTGHGEFSAAYTYGQPDHWSQLRTRFELSAGGRIGDELRFHARARAEADGAYQLEDAFYPDAVKRDQQSDLMLREAYLDFSAAGWDYRLGRQQIVWGEVVGLFLADVVSARDTREFFLPEFDSMRIAQWAVRAEKFAGDSHFELLWVPYQSYDESGKPGADFYPFPVPAGTPVEEIIPSRSDLGNSSLGLRYSRLLGGWDLTGFFYQSNDVSPTLYQTAGGLELRHDRINQLGGTFSKAWMDFVLKGEAVFTAGRSFASEGSMSPYGLEESDSLEYVVGLMAPRGDWLFDFQLYARHLFDHEPEMLYDAGEYGITLLANYHFNERLEAEILYLAGLNRSDYSVQSSVTWSVNSDWRLQLGVDMFDGDEIGFYGRYDEQDRVFLALRRWF